MSASGGGGGGGGIQVPHIIQQAVAPITNLFAPPKAPEPTQPTTVSASQATPQASTSAIQNTIAKERNAFATSTVLTSGAGLLDEPTTTSRVLMGS